jgi:cytochrome c peroxidase
MKQKIYATVATVILIAGCFNLNKKTTTEQVLKIYRSDVMSFKAEVTKLDSLVKINAPQQILQDQFKQARKAYKYTECLAEYYNAYTAKQINGPALDEVEEDEKSKIIPPEGFQVVEELLFPSYDSLKQNELSAQVAILRSNAGRLEYVASTLQTSDAHIFDAMRLQIFRVISLGLAGFDSPIANNTISETKASVEAIQNYYLAFDNKLSAKNAAIAQELKNLFTQTNNYLLAQNNLEAFDRLQFITDYLNPLSEKLLAAQTALSIPILREPRFLKADAATLFAQDIFNTGFYSPNPDDYSNNDKVALGKKLFYDNVLSGDGKRSCATCHQADKAFTDGLKTSLSVSGINVRRNAPTLINAALQPALFYDTRVSYLEDQAGDVINNKDEMHGSLEQVILFINNNKQYKKLYEKVYPNQKVTETQIKNAIASYMRSLVALNSRFDRYMRGNKGAMNETEKYGFNLFMGKGKCGTCHFTPLFNGNNPPAFSKTDAEVLGVPATTDTINPALDDDEGKYALYKVPIHKHAFKTPTLRNIELTTPYMHNGIYRSLEEVIEFYNRGGGNGLGLKVENQTLPAERLNLTGKEKQAIIAFMKTLTDTSVAGK